MGDSIQFQFKLRHSPEFISGRLQLVGEGDRARIVLDRDKPRIVPGQFVAFYMGDVCLGSGVVDDLPDIHVTIPTTIGSTRGGGSTGSSSWSSTSSSTSSISGSTISSATTTSALPGGDGDTSSTITAAWDVLTINTPAEIDDYSIYEKGL